MVRRGRLQASAQRGGQHGDYTSRRGTPRDEASPCGVQRPAAQDARRHSRPAPAFRMHPPVSGRQRPRRTPYDVQGVSGGRYRSLHHHRRPQDVLLPRSATVAHRAQISARHLPHGTGQLQGPARLLPNPLLKCRITFRGCYRNWKYRIGHQVQASQLKY